MKFFFTLLLALAAYLPLSAQTEEIRLVIDNLFDAIACGRFCSRSGFCSPKIPQMFTSFTDKEGNPRLVQDDFAKFLQSVGTPHDEVYDEKIWSYDISD